MRSRARSVTAIVLLSTTLIACASSGVSHRPSDDLVEIAIPADLKVCFGRKVAPPPVGKMTRRALFRKLAEFKASDDGKSECGRRLVCYIEDVARALLPADRRAAPDPSCAVAGPEGRLQEIGP